MNLFASLGAPCAARARRERAPKTTAHRPRPQGRDDTNHLEQVLRFAWWAHQLARFPSVAQVMTRFDVSRATAYRWRNALAAAHGIETPPDEDETDEKPGQLRVAGRRSR